MITYLLNTLVDSIKTSLINKLGLDPSTEVDLDDFPQLIDDIPILDSVEELTVTENGTYTGTGGVTYNPVNVNLPLGSKSVTANGTYTASDDSLQGYSSVTVDIDDTDLYRDTTDSTYESVKTLSNCGAFPMLSLTAEINAVQDLHGYDKPWAGGAGKNKFDADTFYSSYKQSDGSYRMGISPAFTTHCNIPSSLVGVACVFSGYLKLDENTTLTNVRPIVNVGGTNIDGTIITSTDYTTFALSFTPTSTSDYICIDYGSGGGYIQMKELQLEAGTTATTYSPYSNICPISGWDAIDVCRCGKNLLPTGRGYNFPYNADYGTVLDVDTDTPDWIDDENGEYEVTLSDWQRCGLLSNQLPIGETVYVRIKIVSGSPSVSTYTLDADYRVIRKFSNYNPASDGLDYNTQIQLAENEHYVGVAIVGHNNKVIIRNPHIVLNTDEPYEPYNGQTYTTALSTTCYGGSKDIKGNEIHNRVYVDMGDLNYTYNNGFFRTSELASIIKKPSDNLTKVNAISSIYVAETWNAISNTDDGKFAVSSSNGEMIICNLAYSSASDFKTAMSGVQLVYELATPTTATSDAIDLTLAEGVNNLWADSGDVGDARYFRKVEL